ncbi:hypothetical protein [Streptomyces bobili]|uniref:hypothetical protein n=1 Tax=Streptomyces bobili TaxID=67280 RepID=UPI00371A72FE
MTRTDDGSRTPDPYLLFAHEPYYPGPDTQEINTTVVPARCCTRRSSSRTAPTSTPSSPAGCAGPARSSPRPYAWGICTKHPRVGGENASHLF